MVDVLDAAIKLDIQLKQSGLKKTQDSLRRVTREMDGLIVASKGLFKDQKSLERQQVALTKAAIKFRDLKAAIRSSTSTVQQQGQALGSLTTSYNSYAKALRAGTLTQNELNIAADRFNKTARRVSPAAATAAARIKKVGEASTKAAKEVNTLQKRASELSKSVQVALGPLSGVASRITALAALGSSTNVAMGFLIGGVIALGAALAKAAADGAKLELFLSKAGNRVRFLGNTAALTTTAMNDLAETLARDTLAGLDEARDSVLTLTTAMSANEDQIKRSLFAAQALSDAGFGRLTENTRLFARILERPAENLNALRRFGVQFNAVQKRMVSNMVAMGNATGAANFILAEAEKRTKGLSRNQEGLTFALDTLGAAAQRLSETIGLSLQDSLVDVVKRFTKAVDILRNNTAIMTVLTSIASGLGEAFAFVAFLIGGALSAGLAIVATQAKVVGIAFRLVWAIIKDLVGLLPDLSTEWNDAGSAISNFVKKAGARLNLFLSKIPSALNSIIKNVKILTLQLTFFISETINGLIRVFDRIGTLFTSLFTDLANKDFTFTKTTEEFKKGIFEGAKEGSEAASKKLQEEIDKLADQDHLAPLKKAWVGVAEFAEKNFSNTTGAVKKEVKELKTFFDGIFGEPVEPKKKEEKGGPGKSRFDDFLFSIQNQLDSVSKKTAEVENEISILGSRGNRAADDFRNMSSALQGFVTSAGLTGDAAKEVATNIAAGLSPALATAGVDLSNLSIPADKFVAALIKIRDTTLELQGKADLARILKDNADPLKELTVGLERANEAQKIAEASLQGVELERALDAIARYRQGLVDAAQANDFFLGQVKVMSEGVVDLFADWATGAEDAMTTFKATLSNIITEIIKEMFRLLVINKITNAITDALGASQSSKGAGGFLGGLFTSIGAAIFGGINPATTATSTIPGGANINTTFGSSAMGNAFNGGRLTRLAQGGIVSSPTMFKSGSSLGLMGEAGAEAVMPLARDGAGRLGVRGTGGGGNTIIIDLRFSNGSEEIERRVVEGISRAAPGIIGASVETVKNGRSRDPGFFGGTGS